MKSKRTSIALLCLVTVFGFSFCKGPVKENGEFRPSKQQRAEDAIKSWMFENYEYPDYKPIVFGQVNARYERSERTLQLMTMIEKKENEDGGKGHTAEVDSLKTLLEQNLGELLGYTILHKFSITNLAGEPVETECLFLLDTLFRVASVLNPEEFDLILTEKVFYRVEQ
ncbi:MAG TPA: hypothetical protein PLO02_07990 [Tenuifilaceae bacterium]|jgi:hypothetical protein|nr:hypothetical protein [Bacteroidales bacterium]MDI9516059.1 hypothetical protein [Bacteroidota bacterium]NLH56431.1 hypothetical protein [Rikenellaceae bacterium]OQC62279.1 MAG: hypothetical protein BWX49_01794 [Bacteroidetes bacterium ADurb.Bin008]HNV81655.1 hypothetical protein [Tenuifilaceae bacterium]